LSSSAKLFFTLIFALPVGATTQVFAESSGSHAAAAHHDGHGKGDNETNECYGLIKKHPYKALQCYEAVDPTLKVLLKKDTDGNAIYENLIRACGHDYVGGLVNAKELGICRRKLIVLDKYPRQP
jgi:hypothetical protein